MSNGGLWSAKDILSKERLNQKTIYVGDSEPSETYPGQVWFDTSSNVFKVRNSADSAWITISQSPHASEHEYGGSDLIRNLDYLQIRGTTVIDSGRSLSNFDVASDLLPDVNNTRNLGGSSLKWKSLYLNDRLYIGADTELYRNNVDFLRTPDRLRLDYPFPTYYGSNNPLLGLNLSGTTLPVSAEHIRLYSFDSRDYGNAIEFDLAWKSLSKVWYYDGSSYTDLTTTAKAPGGSEFILLEDTDDYLYLGFAYKFSFCYFDLSTTGANVTLSWEYWNGSNWTSLSVTDDTDNFSQDGWVTWTNPEDWEKTSVNGSSQYWVRVKTTTTPTTVPKAIQVSPSVFIGNFLHGQINYIEKFRLCYTGDLQLAGKIYLGNSEEAEEFQTTYYIGRKDDETYINTHFRPTTTGNFDLGTSSYRWRDILLSGTIDFNGVNLYKGGTDLLKTDDSLLVGGYGDFNSLKVGGTEIVTNTRVLQNITTDASVVTSGTFDVARIPDLTRSKITDFWSSPFWNNIPDKPSDFTPSEHGNEAHNPDFTPQTTFDAHTVATSGEHGVGSNYIAKTSRSDQWPDWNDIQNKPSSFTPSAHASTHEQGGSDEVSLDASQITSGRLVFGRLPTSGTADRFLVVRNANSDPSYDTLSVNDIPDLTRSKITDFWSTPFWNNIPDKPSTFPPESHTHDASDVTSGVFDLARIPTMDDAHIPDVETLSYGGAFAVDQIPNLDTSKITSGRFSLSRMPTSGNADRFLVVRTASSDPTYDTLNVNDIPTLTRSKISDFWGSPFWNNIPDKPSTFPPEAHASSHANGGSDEVSLDASQIVSGRFSLSRLPTSTSDNRILLVRTANSDPEYNTLVPGDIPDLNASKITSGVFNASRIPWTGVNSNLLPSSDGAFSLGSSSYKWSDLYVDENINLSGTIVFSGDTYLERLEKETITGNTFAPKVTVFNQIAGAGTTTFAYDDTTDTLEATNWSRVKRIQLSFIVPTTCTLRIYFEGKGGYDGNNIYLAYARIYKNGSAYGTTRTLNSLGFTPFIQDLQFSKGDYVELWGYSSNASWPGAVRNFRIQASFTGKLINSDASFKIERNVLEWGTLNVYDVNLYRDSSNVLRTDDSFSANALKIGTTEIVNSSRELKNITYTGNLLPTIGGIYDLGSSTSEWSQLYLDDDFYMNGIKVLDSNRVLQNVTADAGIITSGEFDEARIPHNWTSALNVVLSYIDSSCLTSKLSGDSNYRFYILTSGKMYWGQGSTGVDTNLYRSAANRLKTDDNFDALSLLINGSTAINSSKRWVGSFYPSSADTYSLGSSSYEWSNLYIGSGKIFFGTSQDVNLYRSNPDVLATDDDFTIKKNSANILLGYNRTGPHGLRFGQSTSTNPDGYDMQMYYRTTARQLEWEDEDSNDLMTLDRSGNLKVFGDITVVDDILPSSNETSYIGSSSYRFLAIYSKNFTAFESCVPDADNGADLGLSGQKWAQFYSYNKNAAWEHPLHNPHVAIVFTCVEGPKVTVEDWGSSKLENGEIFVTFTEEFAALISDQREYAVFLTPEGECNGLKVIEKHPHGFKVKELGNGTSSVKFNWLVKAIRIGDEDKEVLEPWYSLEGTEEERKKVSKYLEEKHEKFKLKEKERLKKIEKNILRYRDLVKTEE